MPKTNNIPEEPKLKVRKQTRQRETGSSIPIFLINGEQYISLYDVRSFLKEDCNDSENKLRYDFRKKIQTFQRKRAREILVLPQKEIVNKIDQSFKVHLNPTKKSNFIKYKHLKNGEFDYLIKDYHIPIEENFVISFEMDLTPHLPKIEDVSKISSPNNPIINTQVEHQNYRYPKSESYNNPHNPFFDNYPRDQNPMRMENNQRRVQSSNPFRNYHPEDYNPRVNNNPIYTDRNPFRGYNPINHNPRSMDNDPRINNPLSSDRHPYNGYNQMDHDPRSMDNNGYDSDQLDQDPVNMKSVPPKNPLYHSNQFFERPIIYIQNNYPPNDGLPEKLDQTEIPLEPPILPKHQSNLLPPLKNHQYTQNFNHPLTQDHTIPQQNSPYPHHNQPKLQLRPLQHQSPHPLVKQLRPLSHVTQRQVFQEHQRSFRPDPLNQIYDNNDNDQEQQESYPDQSYEQFNEMVEKEIKQNRFKRQKNTQHPFQPNPNQTNQLPPVFEKVGNPLVDEETDSSSQSPGKSLNSSKQTPPFNFDNQPLNQLRPMVEQGQTNIVSKIKHILDICK